MKNPDIRMILLLSFPPVFAVLFVLYLRIFPPIIPPELSWAFGLLFLPVFLMVIPLLMIPHGQAIIVGFFLFAFLCVAVEYFYWRVLQRGQRGERIPLAVATYLLICLVMGLVLLPAVVPEEHIDLVLLTLRDVDKNETSGYVVHFESQDLEEFPALKSLIESGHASMSTGEWDTFRQRYSPGSFVEYNGTYYAFDYGITK